MRSGKDIDIDTDIEMVQMKWREAVMVAVSIPVFMQHCHATYRIERMVQQKR